MRDTTECQYFCFGTKVEFEQGTRLKEKNLVITTSIVQAQGNNGLNACVRSTLPGSTLTIFIVISTVRRFLTQQWPVQGQRYIRCRRTIAVLRNVCADTHSWHRNRLLTSIACWRQSNMAGKSDTECACRAVADSFRNFGDACLAAPEHVLGQRHAPVQ
jgi:hypothetical protein